MSFRPSRITGGSYSDQVSYLPIKSTVMFKSRAIGGPLDGVVLEGPNTWDGRVKNSASNKMHPGRYHWDNKNWAWLEDLKQAAINLNSTDWNDIDYR